MVTTVE